MAVNLSVLPIWLYRKCTHKQTSKSRNLETLSERANDYFEDGEKYFEEKRFRPALMAFVNAQKAFLDMLDTKEITEKEKALATQRTDILQEKVHECILQGAKDVRVGMGKKFRHDDLVGYAKLEQIYTKADVIFFGEEEDKSKSTETKEAKNKEEEATQKYLADISEASAFCAQAIQELEKQELAEKQSEPSKIDDRVELNKQLVKTNWPKFYDCVQFAPTELNFAHIIGSYELKRKLRANVLLPFKNSCLFEDREKDSSFELTNAALLYGPPGTGKTNFALALSNLSEKTTFIKITNAQIKSKYHGETEQNIDAIFAMAAALQPCIVFIDEAEQMLGNRNRKQGSEFGKDVTVQFLALMQTTTKGTFFIASTNIPSDIDPAILRRFPKKFMVDMPSSGEIALMLKFHMRNMFCLMTDDEYRMLAAFYLDGFTPSDVQTLCKLTGEELLMDVADATHFKPCPYRKGQWVPANPSDPDAVLLPEEETNSHKISTSPVYLKHVKKVLREYEPDGRKITEEDLREMRKFQRGK